MEQKGEEQQMVYELEIKALTENLQDVLDFVEGHMEEMDAPMKVMIQMNIAVEEIFVNIAHYAYKPDTGMAVIQVETDRENNQVSITFIDAGKPFDPLAKPDPDVTLSSEERNIGGLGIYMVKKSMDEVSYVCRDGKNVFSITKNW